MSRAEKRRAEREARKQQQYSVSGFNKDILVGYRPFECDYELPFDTLGYSLNHYESQGYSKPEAIASTVLNLCAIAVEKDEETRAAFALGRDINFNLGKGGAGNIINITYSPKRKRFEEPLFDAWTFAKLGVGMNELVKALCIIASTSNHHQEAFASLTN